MTYERLHETLVHNDVARIRALHQFPAVETANGSDGGDSRGHGHQIVRDRMGQMRTRRRVVSAKADNYARVPWLTVTLLIRADELCIGQHVALHCSLNL